MVLLVSFNYLNLNKNDETNAMTANIISAINDEYVIGARWI